MCVGLDALVQQQQSQNLPGGSPLPINGLGAGVPDSMLAALNQLCAHHALLNPPSSEAMY